MKKEWNAPKVESLEIKQTAGHGGVPGTGNGKGHGYDLGPGMGPGKGNGYGHNCGNKPNFGVDEGFSV